MPGAAISRRGPRRARLLPFALSLLAILVLGGCDTGGGNDGGGTPDDVAEPATVIDLAPGRTSVQLQWLPSRGVVSRYQVFERRNGRDWRPISEGYAPTVRIEGTDGDEVQIQVVAFAPNGAPSQPSPPSPVLRFHGAPPPAAAAATVALRPTAAVATATHSTRVTAEPAPEPSSSSSEEPSAALARARAETAPSAPTPTEAPSSDPDPADEPTAVRPLEAEARSELLRADPRLRLGGVSTGVADWLAARVEAESVPELTLLGTGHLDDDGLPELVWQDGSSGRLRISDGAALDAGEPIRETLTDGLTLAGGERFLALQDVDGDGRGDWLLEDLQTGRVWIVDDATLAARNALPATPAVAPLMVGLGDLDLDGRVELLWQTQTGSLAWSRADDDGPLRPLHDHATDAAVASEILFVADLDGDGREDLLLSEADGSLAVAHPIASATGIGLRIRPAPEASGDEALAALDLDGDGAWEIAWLVDGRVERWSLQPPPSSSP